MAISADEKLTGGSVKVSLMYGFLPFYQHTFDLCELLQKVKKNCTVPRGILDITVETKISPDIPGVSWPRKLVLILSIIYANSEDEPNKS